MEVCPCRYFQKCVPIAISDGVDVSEVTGCRLLQKVLPRSQKLFQGMVFNELQSTSFLTQ